jgi:hypothetical protein
VLAYQRGHGDERWLVLVNFTGTSVTCDVSGTVAVASDGVGEGATFSGIVGPDQALLLR